MDSRPNRSDAHLSKEDEVRVEEETRDYFEGIAPKRHTKPQRSEPNSTQYHDDCTDDNSSPELAEFQRLQGNPEKLVYTAGSKEQAEEEFTETDYYKDLNCVDKHHHTTGTGFISIANPFTDGFKLVPDSDTDLHPSYRGNPATNDWIPSLVAQVKYKSGKPGRSEN
uniref:Maternal effect embryo arrest 59 n=1 Tax=Kalanchoe fedtschenkoi TaxID=63787 RepID=A0A7N0TCR8_KALFE